MARQRFQRKLLSFIISSVLASLACIPSVHAQVLNYNGSQSEYDQLSDDPVFPGHPSFVPTEGVNGNVVNVTDTDDLSGTGTYNSPFRIYGGWGGDAIAVSNNTVNITGGSVESYIYGGKSLRNSESTGNRVNISGGTVTGNVFGGAAGSNNVTGNSVNISGGAVDGNVFGGILEYGVSGSVSGNSVNISGGTVNGNVYGGHGRIATGNTITLTGGTITGNIYGGFAGHQARDLFTGNTLNVASAQGATLSVGSVQNVETLNFDLSTLSTSTAALTTIGDVTLGSVSQNKDSIINIAGISTTSATDAAIISVGGTLSGNFSQTAGGMSVADFISYNIRNDGNALLADYTLSWVNSNPDQAHGTFTLKDANNVFTVGAALSDNGNISGINGAGWNGKDLTKAGEGTLILTGANTYTGATTVSAGTLKLGKENAIASTSGVTVAQSGTLNLGGLSQTVTSLNNSGTLLINDLDADPLTNIVTLLGDVTNSGSVIINNCASCAGQTLAVDGNWVGAGGTLFLGTALGGDGSPTDKLAIGGNASGTTYVKINNEDGSGAQTLEGIELITTGSSTAGAFVQSGRIVAGSNEYSLQQGTASGMNMDNWYLSSIVSGPDPDIRTYRPERGSYVSNLQAAGTMFNTRLKDRHASGVYTDPVTGERSASSLWARAVGGHTEGRISDGQSKYMANRMVFQVGGDVMNTRLLTEDALHLGVMGGYGKQSSNTRNGLSGYRSKGSVWGYGAGLYGTWYQNAKDQTGLYMDSWALYNWFDNSVKGDELAYETYKSKGLTASLESGYKFHAGAYFTNNGMENNIYVTPLAQVLWSGVKADNHTEVNGTKVEGRGNNNVQTRLGVRLSMTGQSHLDKKSVRQFEPFVEANWVYTMKDYGVKMGDSSAYLEGGRNVTELKAGVEGRVSENLNVWGNVTQQMGSHFYDTQGMLGVNYVF